MRMRKAIKRDVLVGEIDGTLELDESYVVVKIARVVLGVDDNRDDVLLDVRIELRLAVDVPFTESHAKLGRCESVSIPKFECCFVGFIK